MNTNTMTDALSTTFHERFNDYRKIRSWSSFEGNINTLLETFMRCGFSTGTVETGECGGIYKAPYILVVTKAGCIMVYQQQDGSLHYFCEDSYAACSSAKMNGFGQTVGTVITSEQLDHFFAIADSYLD